jgi:hypothetical protein
MPLLPHFVVLLLLVKIFQKANKRIVHEKTPSQELQDLQKVWYAKLRATGFKDLEFFTETGVATTSMLNASIGSLMGHYRPESEYYFAKARWYVHHGKFDTNFEALVWQYHSDGVSAVTMSRIFRCGRLKIQVALTKMKAAFTADRRYEQIEAEEIAALAARFYMKAVK